jgi:hypothetical protein
MYFSLIFQNSGDKIICTTDKADLLEYYVEFIEKCNANKFNLITKNNTSLNIDRLLESLKFINETFFSDLHGKFTIPLNKLDVLDQTFLNKTHAKWVNNQLKNFDVNKLKHSDFAYKLAHLFKNISDDIQQANTAMILCKYDYMNMYNNINELIHSVESGFSRLRFQADFDNWIEVNNLFPKSYTSNSLQHVSLSFNHYGRQLYNKYVNWDLDLDHDDENTFDQLLGFINLDLRPAETFDYSLEYKEWCKKHNRIPTGQYLNLGNIENLDTKLHEYRKIIFRNLQAKDKFKIVLGKG